MARSPVHVTLKFLTLVLLMPVVVADPLTQEDCMALTSRPIHAGTSQSVTPSRPPRVFPLCISTTPGSSWPAGMKKAWEVVLEHLQDNPPVDERYDESIHHAKSSNNYGVKLLAVTLLAEGNDMEILQRRIAFQFFLTNPMSSSVKGIFLQGIKGPLGIPFGQFKIVRKWETVHAEHEILTLWKVEASAQTLFEDNAYHTHCTLFPNTHSSILDRRAQPFIYTDNNGFSKDVFQLEFSWEDAPCSEASFFQFLMIIVTNFETSPPEYRPMLTEVVTPATLEFSNTGGASDAPNSYRLFKWVNMTVSQFSRIIPNLDYEMCIRENVYSQGDQCPPGGYNCARANTGNKDFHQHEIEKAEQNYKLFNTPRPICPSKPPLPTPPITVPSTNKTTTTEFILYAGKPPDPPPPPPPPTKVDNLTKTTAKKAVKTERKKIITHSELAIYVWFILLPAGNYVARYFKDFPNVGMGLGYWIIAHVVTHHIGILLMWVSFGLVLSNGKDFFGAASIGHFWFGLFATLIQHALIFESAIMEIKGYEVQGITDKPAFHVVISHAATVCALIATFYQSDYNSRDYIFVALIFLLNFSAWIIGGWIDYKMENYLGVFPPRRWFPELEHIVLEGPEWWTMPYTKYKLLFYICYVMLLHGLYVCIVFW